MKCFYHADHDGHCAAYWVRKRYPNATPEDFIEINYGYDFNKQVLDKISENDVVVIVDFSFDPEEMRTIYNKVKSKVVWVDHHKSAIEKYADFDLNIEGLRVDGIAGCMLSFKYFTGKEYTQAPWMTKYIADYDVWKYEYGDETKHFQLGLQQYEDTNPFAKIWDELIEDHGLVVKLIEDGVVIERYKNAFNAGCLDRGFEYEIDGVKVFCMNNIKGNSTNFLYKMQEYDACLQFYFDGELWQYSMYSEKIDTTQIHICDTKFEGHKGASGCQSKILFCK